MFSLNCSLHCIIGPSILISMIHLLIGMLYIYFFFFLLFCCKICIILPFCGCRIQYVLSLSGRRIAVESNLNEQTSFFLFKSKEKPDTPEWTPYTWPKDVTIVFLCILTFKKKKVKVSPVIDMLIMTKTQTGLTSPYK